MTYATGTQKRKAMVTTVDDIGNVVTRIHNPYPDLTAGDLAYLDQSRLHDVQIRPMLDNERPPATADDYPPGSMWLVWTSRSGVQVRGVVHMPAPYRKNIRSNVALAIKKTAKFSPLHGKLFALAHSGVDPFDKSE